MLIDYKEIYIDFDERNVSEEKAKEIGDIVLIASNQTQALVSEVNMEDENNGMIFIDKKEEPDMWDKDTINFLKTLEEISDFNLMYSDEDYGEGTDALIFYKDD